MGVLGTPIPGPGPGIGYNNNKRRVAMPIRRISLVNGEIYHVCNKSIAGFKIFNHDRDYNRMMELLSFYMAGEVPCDFSTYKKLKNVKIDSSKRAIDLLAYCIMPTHIHFLLRQIRDGGIKKFIGSISQSYSQYFNILHERKGPLWEGRFANIAIKNDEQLLHLIRYIHLNPVTAFLVNDPGSWRYSSYNEYFNTYTHDKKLCEFSEILKIDLTSYKKFTLDQIDYQRQLAIVKEVALDS
jgi:putative transposase